MTKIIGGVPSGPKYKKGDTVFYLDIDVLAREGIHLHLDILKTEVTAVFTPAIEEVLDCENVDRGADGKEIARYYEEVENLYDTTSIKAVKESRLFETMRAAWNFAERIYFKGDVEK